jgi:hypothetical protein
MSDELAEARFAVTLDYPFEKETDMFPFAVSSGGRPSART